MMSSDREHIYIIKQSHSATIQVQVSALAHSACPAAIWSRKSEDSELSPLTIKMLHSLEN